MATTLDEKDKVFIEEWREFLNKPFNDVMSRGYNAPDDFYDPISGYEEHNEVFIDPEKARERLKERLEILKCLYYEYVWVVTDDKIATIAQQLVLLPELDTPLARKTFARAIDKGYMEKDGEKLHWIGYGRGRNVQFYYLCKCIYGDYTIPAKALNEQFDFEKTVDFKGIRRDFNNKNDEQDWVKVIDKLFE